MRTGRTLVAALLTFTSGLMACTDPGNNNGTSSSDSSSSSNGDPNGITGSAKDTFWAQAGDELVYFDNRWSAVEAISDKSYSGTIVSPGAVSIPDVPTGPYWLALTATATENFPTAPLSRAFIEMDAREIDIGRLYTGRSDVAPMTMPSNIIIDANFSVPFQNYEEDMNGNIIQSLTDDVQIVSRGAGLWGYTDNYAELTAPTNGATQVSGWTFDMQSYFQNLMDRGAPLVEAAKGDDFIMVHSTAAMEGSEMPDGNPWTGYMHFSAKESASVADVSMVDGMTTNVSANFASLTQKNFALDYKGSAFNALLPAGIVDPVSVSLSVLMEVGTPNPGIGTFAYLWTTTVSTESAFTNPNPACQGVGCDPMACAGACDLGMPAHPGDYAHGYTYGNPFSYGQELFSAVVSFSYNVKSLLPEMTAERLRGSMSISIPAAEANGKSIQPTLSLPQNIKVAGQPTNLAQITTGVGLTPIVSWDAPAMGTPTHYRVTVIDLSDLMGADGAVSTRRTVATMETTKTQVTIPAGIMKSATNYYFLVTAYAVPGYDSSKPFVYGQHEATARMFSGVVTP